MTEDMGDEQSQRYIPTPRELEDGTVEKGVRSSRAGRSAPEVSRTQRLLRRLHLSRRQTVGRERTYEEVDPMDFDAVATRAAASSVDADTMGRPAAVEGPSEAKVAGRDESQSDAAPRTRRVRSVTFRQPTGPVERPRYEPNSKEGIFYRKAEEMGHQMGELAPEGQTTNFRATCIVCGTPGRIVVQFADMMVTHSADYFSGKAFERRCTGGTDRPT